MAITASGIGSGLDIDNLIAQLVAAEGRPKVTVLNKREFELQADLSALGTLKGALSDFLAQVKKLGELSSFQSRSAVSGNTELFTAVAGSSAVPGSYDIEVLQLAASAKLQSGDFASESEAVGTGTLTISLGSESFQIAVDDGNKTLAGVRDAINAAADNPGISASIIHVDSGYRLVLSSSKTGAVNTISVDADDDDNNDIDNLNLSRLAGSQLTTIQTARDAVIKVDQQTATRSGNVIGDVLAGVTITLVKEEPGVTASLTVSLDKGGIREKISGFVDAYNSLADTLKTLSGFNAETGEAGVLLGDSTLRSIQNRIRSILSDQVPGLSFSSLAEIGVTTDSQGHLTLNSEKLDGALNAQFDDIAQLFASESGLANRLTETLDRYLTGGGLLEARTEGIQNRIDDIADDRVRLDRRLALLEARYRAQFTALDALLSQLQTTGVFLTQQLAGLPAANSGSN
ncbi:MAG: flagellar filament capping protein FliD [Gammaproteobacteria bacterium]